MICSQPLLRDGLLRRLLAILFKSDVLFTSRFRILVFVSKALRGRLPACREIPVEEDPPVLVLDFREEAFPP